MGFIFEEIESRVSEKSSLQNILLSDNFEESIDSSVKDGPKTDAFTLSDDLWA